MIESGKGHETTGMHDSVRMRQAALRRASPSCQ